jgi:prepilin-type N-terminal cleavage/methylation domain-containing protein
MHSLHASSRFDDAFTLIELLVVIAIIAILSVVVILTLNPAALLQQSRDSNRISDMSTLNTALGIYLAQGGASLGSSNTVYISIPDPTATSTAGDQCQGLGLISLPATYSYHCAATSTYRSVDGTGWIPVNFFSLPAGAPLGQLPQDPINTTSSREYYTYNTNGTQYEVTSVMESQKYQIGGSNDVISNDGGRLASVYEKGNTYGLEPMDYGDPTLVGLWSFNEGTGTVAYDYSGSNATGSWSGTQIGTNGYYSTNAKVGSYAGDCATTSISLPSSTSLNIPTAITLSAWVNLSASQPYSAGIIAGRTAGVDEDYEMEVTGQTLGFNYYNGSSWYAPSGFGTIPLNSWAMLSITRDAAGANIDYYINGSLIQDDTGKGPGGGYGSNGKTLCYDPGNTSYLRGLIDDVRVYNRALTAAQIAAMYAGGK